ncbi:MAG: DUF4169 family protein [Halocynthiibacter sp.]
MAKITSLARLRKSRARTDKRALADTNAVRFGQSSAAKQRAAKKAEMLRRHLDQHKREIE